MDLALGYSRLVTLDLVLLRNLFPRLRVNGSTSVFPEGQNLEMEPQIGNPCSRIPSLETDGICYGSGRSDPRETKPNPSVLSIAYESYPRAYG